MGLFEAGFNLPPGVSPNDPHIAGYPLCAVCGHEAEVHVDDSAMDADELPGGSVGRPLGGERCLEPGCNCTEYQRFADQT